MTLSPDLLEILACPQCRGLVRLDERQMCLTCDHCKLLFEIRDGIPIMLAPQEAASGR
ncbi:MAG: Trm112 family protein [Smithellaceae bacterium]